MLTAGAGFPLWPRPSPWPKTRGAAAGLVVGRAIWMDAEKALRHHAGPRERRPLYGLGTAWPSIGPNSESPHAESSSTRQNGAVADSADRRSRRTFPVTVRHLPVVRCEVCDHAIPHRPGKAGAVLTAHYERAHPHAVAQAARKNESCDPSMTESFHLT
jgi:hypothetical protein